ncbi:MAG TPA: hypothetical protein VF438_02305, partial [Candidatus Paceibacterota bacterium]
SYMKRLNSVHISAEELLVVRSVACMTVAFLLVGWRVTCSPASVKKAGFIIAISSISFYQAIQVWGEVNPVIAIAALIPAMNIYLARRDGLRVPASVYASLVCLVVGVFMALKPWSVHIHVLGAILALICVVVSAIGFDLWGKAPLAVTAPEKCFWLSVWALLFAVLIMAGREFLACMPRAQERISHLGFSVQTFDIAPYRSSTVRETLFWFGGIGAVYLFSTIIPFSRSGKMKTEWASVFIQGATPASMIGAYYLVGERLDVTQRVGVGIALAGAGYLSFRLFRSNEAL